MRRRKEDEWKEPLSFPVAEIDENFDIEISDDSPLSSASPVASAAAAQPKLKAEETRSQKSGSSSSSRVAVAASSEATAVLDVAERAEEATADGEAPPVAFEGEGLSNIGSAKHSADDFDDEFDYAFEGGERQGETHQQVFKHKALPAHLVTNVKQAQLNAVMEDGEEDGEEEEGEEEEEEEEEDMDGGDKPKESPGGLAAVVDNDQDEFEASSERVLAAAAAATAAAATAATAAATTAVAAGGGGPFGASNTQPRVSSRSGIDEPSVHSSLQSGYAGRPLPIEPSGAPTIMGIDTTTSLSSHVSAFLQDRQSPVTSEANSNAAVLGSQLNFKNLQATSVGSATTMTSMRPQVSQSVVGMMTDDITSIDTASMADSAIVHTGSIGSYALSAAQGASQQLQLTAQTSRMNIGAAAAEAEDEWELANQERQAELSTPEVASAAAEPISYPDVMETLMSEEPSDPNRRQVIDGLPPPPGFFQRLMCMGTPDLQPALREQQIRLLCLARVAFNDSSPVHFRLLCSLFAAFTGESASQARIGTHWEDVGFQGQDPATDLRSCGILGLLHLYYLHHHNAHNAKLLYSLSRSASQEFPLSIVSMNITKWTLQVMREGLLSRAANRSGSLVETSCHFYVGTFYTFYKTWLSGGKTMAQSGFVLKELEACCRKQIQLMVDTAASMLEVPT